MTLTPDKRERKEKLHGVKCTSNNFFGVASALYSKQNESTADAKHMCTVPLQVHRRCEMKQCTLYSPQGIHCRTRSLKHGKSTCARRCKNKTLGTNPSAVSKILFLCCPPLLCTGEVRKRTKCERAPTVRMRV